MHFENKDVKRAIRNFERKVQNIKNGGHQVYQTRVNELVNLILKNQVINFIVGPYFEIDIDFKKIMNLQDVWFNLNLPEDETLQIAYVLQILKYSKEGKFTIEDYVFHIFRHKNLNQNISEWNRQILLPCLQILLDKLHDLIEDKVEGKDFISASSLNIVNHGNINCRTRECS